MSGILIFFSSERVAAFLFIYFFYFFTKNFSKKKIFVFLFLIFSIITISISQPRLIDKYIPATLTQFGILDTYTIYDRG